MANISRTFRARKKNHSVVNISRTFRVQENFLQWRIFHAYLWREKIHRGEYSTHIKGKKKIIQWRIFHAHLGGEKKNHSVVNISRTLRVRENCIQWRIFYAYLGLEKIRAKLCIEDVWGWRSREGRGDFACHRKKAHLIEEEHIPRNRHP